MGWLDPAISVPRVTYRRLAALAEEIEYLESGDELETWEQRDRVEELITNILDEYVRQHFEESTKTAAKMLNMRRIQRSR